MPAYKDEAKKTWYVSFYYKDWTGKTKRKLKRGFKKRQEALDYEREFLNKGKLKTDMTFGSLVELYLADKENRIRETTMDVKKYILDTKVLPYFKDLKVDEIEATTIRNWQNELLKQGYAETYLKTINNQLSAIFNHAVRFYKLHENPCRIAGSIGKNKADEMLFWTLDEFNQFIASVDKPAINLAFKIMYWSGTRVGETVALKPKDILKEKIIDINKTTSRKDGIDHYYDPKTTKSARQVPIPDFLYDDIQDYIKSLYEIDRDEKIFYFTKSTLNKNLDYFADVAEVKRIRVHDLRHSHAALLIEMNVNIKLISERLGHENVETTWNTYGHLYPNKQIQLANELNDLQLKTLDNNKSDTEE